MFPVLLWPHYPSRLYAGVQIDEASLPLSATSLLCIHPSAGLRSAAGRLEVTANTPTSLPVALCLCAKARLFPLNTFTSQSFWDSLCIGWHSSDFDLPHAYNGSVCHARLCTNRVYLPTYRTLLDNNTSRVPRDSDWHLRRTSLVYQRRCAQSINRSTGWSCDWLTGYCKVDVVGPSLTLLLSQVLIRLI